MGHKRPYRDGVKLHDIVRDGWARGFNILQTYSEAHQMGFSIDIEVIQDKWDKWDKEYETNQAILARANKLEW